MRNCQVPHYLQHRDHKSQKKAKFDEYGWPIEEDGKKETFATLDTDKSGGINIDELRYEERVYFISLFCYKSLLSATETCIYLTKDPLTLFRR